jgi:hypothetical protein
MYIIKNTSHDLQFRLSEEQINAGGDALKSMSGADPLGMRVGKPCDPVVAKTLEKCAEEAEMAISNVCVVRVYNI